MWITGSYMIQVSQTNLRYETFSLHWNGSTWSDVAMPLVSGSDTLLAYEFSSMDAISPTNVWAVGGSGDNVIGIGHAERIAPRRRFTCSGRDRQSFALVCGHRTRETLLRRAWPWEV